MALTQAQIDEQLKLLDALDAADMQPKQSALESGVKGFASSAAQSFLDEALGGIVPLTRPDLYSKDAATNYRTARQDARDVLARAEKDNPASYMTGQVGGALTSAIAASPIGVLSPTTVRGAVGAGAIYGGLNAAGGSEADIAQNSMQLAKDTATGATVGAGVGAGLQAAIPLVGKGVQWVGSKLPQGKMQLLPENMPQATPNTARGLLNDEAGSVNLPKQKETLTASETAIYRSLVEGQGYTPQEAANLVLQAGKPTQTGVKLTLPELSENRTLLGFEKKLRQNIADAGEIEQSFLKNRPQNIQEAFTGTLQKPAPDFVNDVSRPEFGKIKSAYQAGGRIVNTAQSSIAKLDAVRAARAKPFYDIASKQIVPEDVVANFQKNPIIAKAISEVEREPIWQAELAGVDRNSVGFLDVVKKNIDSQIETAQRAGDRTRVAILAKTKNDFIGKVKEISPAYKEALSTFGKNSPRIERMKNTIVGALSDLDSGNVASAGKKLFSETPDGIKYARRVLAPDDREAWGNLVATHLNDIAEKANFRPDKMLTAFTTEGGGNIANVKKLYAAMSPVQRQAFKQIMNDVRKSSLVRTGGSDTAYNLDAAAQLDEAIGATPLTGIGKVAKAVAAPKQTATDLIVRGADRVGDWFNQSVRGQNYTEMAKIFVGDGSEEFAQKILRVKPSSPRAYELISERIAEVSAKTAAQGAVKAATVQPLQDVPEFTIEPQYAPKQAAQPTLTHQQIDEQLRLLDEMDSQLETLPNFNTAPQGNAGNDTLGVYYDRVKGAESGGDANAKNPNSSASGLYQFTKGTWKDMVRKYGKETGVTVGMKNNPQAQEIMMRKLTEENRDGLRKALGREPTDGELYAAHFAGLGGAKSLLRNPSKIAANLLPSAAKSNKTIFYNENGQPRTAMETVQLLASKV
jgi:hypothetical protein